MSPSAAIKMSSPCDRKTRFVPPGRFSKPKNLRLMGGGGGIGGGCRIPASTTVPPGRLGFSMLATDPATKIFLPLPAYLISSLWLSNFRSRVGSRRGSTTGTIFPEAVRRVAGLDAVATAAGVVDTDVDAGQNS